jgi:hypothetical protein
MANAEKFLERMKGETLRLEQAIFALLDFRPEDLPGLLAP